MKLTSLFAPLSVAAVLSTGCAFNQTSSTPAPAPTDIPACGTSLYTIGQLRKCVTAVRENLRLHAQTQVAPLVTEHIGTNRFDFSDFIRDMVAVSDGDACQDAYKAEGLLRRLFNNARPEARTKVAKRIEYMARDYLANLSDCTAERTNAMSEYGILQDATTDLRNLGRGINKAAIKLGTI